MNNIKELDTFPWLAFATELSGRRIPVAVYKHKEEKKQLYTWAFTAKRLMRTLSARGIILFYNIT